MRRYWVLALAAIALLGMLAPPAQAQAPATKVTISGALDMVTTIDRNLSIIDGDLTRPGDREWYSRTRFRPDFIFEVGSAKAVMGLEIDAAFGQTGISDTFLVGSATGGAVQGVSAGAQFSQSGVAFDLNTDTVGAIELKWLYLDFPMTGKDSLLPFIPVPTSARIGAQPTAVTYKLAVLHQGDFAGLNLISAWTPTLKSNLTYVQIDENLEGTRGSTNYGRGNDFAIHASVEYTPMKGLDVRPIYSIGYFEGITGARLSRGGVSNLDTVFRPGDQEARHTFGVDARWKSGNWSLDPTFLWQLGNRTHQVVQNAVWGTRNNAGTSTIADINAWLVDVRGGYTMGPLLLEAMALYTTGNKARDNLNKGVNFYQAISTDSSYYAGGWSAIWGLGIDYYKALHQTATLAGRGVNLTNNIGYDIYGRAQFGVRATYSVTPKIDLRGVVTPAWTAEKVNMYRSVGASGLAPAAVLTSGATYDGTERYLGTEIVGGFTWRFAPGLVFDYEIANLFAGNALDRRVLTNGVDTRRDAEDAFITTGRIRYSF